MASAARGAGARSGTRKYRLPVQTGPGWGEGSVPLSCFSLQEAVLINVIILLSLLLSSPCPLFAPSGGCDGSSEAWLEIASVQRGGHIRDGLGDVFHQEGFICLFAYWLPQMVVRQDEFFMQKNSTVFYCLKNWL